MATEQPINLAEVNDAISGTEFHGWLMHFPTVPSTMDLASEAARAGARHGVWIADEQTAGRGRGGHTWHSAAGDGLYMTTLISPPVPMESVLWLSFRTAMAVQAAIAAVCGFRVREEIDIRWPNDLILNGRKCGGILIDTAARNVSGEIEGTGNREQGTERPRVPMLRYAVVGIGINVNHMAFPPELEAIATSLRREMPQPATPLRREPLAAAILNELDQEIRLMIRGWRGTNNRPDRDLTQFSSWLRGKRVRVEPREGDAAESYTGITAGLDLQGFLRVQRDDGELRTVLSGGLREVEGFRAAEKARG